MGALRVDGVIGRLGDAPSLRFTPSGAAVASVSIVFQESYKNQAGEWVDKEPTWVNATGWREQAENMAEGFSKGDEVIVSGVISTRTYEKRDGTEGTSVDLNLSQIGPTTRRQKVRVHRIQRQQGGDQYDGPAAGPVEDPWTNEPARQAPPQNRQQGNAAPRETRREAGRWIGFGQPVATPNPYPDEPPF